MGKRANRRRKAKRRRDQASAGVAVSQTPRLDEVKAWVAELHATRGQDDLEQPTTTQVADDTRVPSGSIPPPPWKVP